MNASIDITNALPFLVGLMGGGVAVTLVAQGIKKVFGHVIHLMVVAVSVALAAAQSSCSSRACRSRCWALDEHLSMKHPLTLLASLIAVLASLVLPVNVHRADVQHRLVLDAKAAAVHAQQIAAEQAQAHANAVRCSASKTAARMGC